MKAKPNAESPTLTVWDYSKVHRKILIEDVPAYLKQYPNPAGLEIFLYRLHPVIDRKLTGQKSNYIAKIDEHIASFSDTWVMNEFGTGKYQIRINDKNQTSATTRAYSLFTLYDSERPPLYDVKELVLSNPDNKPELDRLRSRGVDLLEGETVKEQNDTRASSDSAQLQNRMLDMLEKKIIAAPLPAAPVVAAPVEDTILMKMFLASTERADRLMMLLMEQRNAPAAPAGDGLGGLRTAKELVGLADEIRGGAVSSSAAVGGSDVAGILQGLGFLAQVVVAGIKDVYAARAQPMQAASPVTQQFYPQSTPTPIPQPMPTPTPGAEMFGLNLSLVEALRVQVPRALQAFELNVLGADFADALCRTPQGEAHYGVLFDAGIDQLKSMLAMAPQLDAMLQAQGKTRADLDAWLDSFIDYGKDEPESGAGENA